MPFDVITFGEAMIRLSPPGFRRLEQSHSLDVEIGGAELNTAVGLARLGRSAAWVSRLTDNPLGRLVANRAREAGVSTDHVVWTDDDRVGLYFFEFGASPRAASVLYDRKGSAAAGMIPGMVAWDRVFAGAKWFHVTGITPALGPAVAEATREAMRAARAAGLRTSLDPNYRAKLWTEDEARRCLQELVPLCDVLLTTVHDAGRFFGVAGTDAGIVAAETARRLGLQAVAITLRDEPLVWRNTWTAVASDGKMALTTRTYEVEIVDRLGAGDAFASGLIHGLLENDLQKGLDWGTALAALKHSTPGDFGWSTAAEVETLLQGGGLRVRR